MSAADGGSFGGSKNDMVNDGKSVRAVFQGSFCRDLVGCGADSSSPCSSLFFWWMDVVRNPHANSMLSGRLSQLVNNWLSIKCRSYSSTSCEDNNNNTTNNNESVNKEKKQPHQTVCV